MGTPAVWDQYARKTLVLSWTVEQEWRVTIGADPISVSQAIAQALTQSGVTSGLPGIVPDSVRFRVEED
jgi:hypothetical protein